MMSSDLSTGFCIISYSSDWLVKCGLSNGKCHMSRVTCHMSRIMCHVPNVTCQMSNITCRLTLLHLKCHKTFNPSQVHSNSTKVSIIGNRILICLHSMVQYSFFNIDISQKICLGLCMNRRIQQKY